MQLLLLNLRKTQKKVTQAEVAKYLGISTKSYRDKENGKREFKQDEMFKLAEYFKLPINQIFLPRTFQIGTKTKNLRREKRCNDGKR